MINKKLDNYVTRTSRPNPRKRQREDPKQSIEYQLRNATHDLLDSLGVPNQYDFDGRNSLALRELWAKRNLPFGSWRRKKLALEEHYLVDWNNPIFDEVAIPPDPPEGGAELFQETSLSDPQLSVADSTINVPVETWSWNPDAPEEPNLERITDARNALQGDPDATAYLSRDDRVGRTDPDRTIHRDFRETSSPTIQNASMEVDMSEPEKGVDSETRSYVPSYFNSMPYFRRRYYRRGYGRRPFYKRRRYSGYRKPSYRRKWYGGYSRIFNNPMFDNNLKSTYFQALPPNVQSQIKANNMIKAAYRGVAQQKYEAAKNAGYGAYGETPYIPFTEALIGAPLYAADFVGRPTVGRLWYGGRRLYKRLRNALTSDAVKQGIDNSLDKIGRQWQLADDYGSRLGSVVGEGLQGVGRMFGFGAYNSLPTPKKNTLMDLGSGVPTIKNSRSGECVSISHREYVGDLIAGTGSPTGFTIQEWDLNPANGLLFPWLSELVNGCFEEWEPAGIIVSVKSMCSDYSTNSALGSMFACVIYNPDEPAPTTKAEVENAEYAVSVKPSESMLMPIECAPVNNTLSHYYLPINGSTPPGRDAKFYNMGKLYIGSQGTPTAGAPLAEIWVTYQFNFFKPKLGFGGGIARNVECDQWVVPNGTGVAAATPFGGTSTPIRLTTGSMDFTQVDPATNTITWHKGAEPLATYLVRFAWSGTSTAIGAAPSLTFSNGGELATNILPTPGVFGLSTWSTTTTLAYWEFFVRNSDTINPREMSVSLSNPASLPASCTNFRILIARVNGDLRGTWSA